MASNEPPDWQQGQPPAQPPQGQPPPSGYPPGQYPPAGYQQQQGQYPQQPGQYPPGYGQPGYPPRKTNGLAVASLVLGLLWVCFIGSILGLILGYIGKKQIDESQGREDGRGLAIAGIVLGWIGVAVLILYVILLMAGAATFEFRTGT